jgi:uncharacterized membrane protein YedE/YeeE
MKRYVVILLAGALFGAGLALSGMTDPSRVIDFLDVAGHWDPALAFVMAGAVVTFGGGRLIWRRLANGKGWFGATLPCAENAAVDRPLVFGAAIFGIGWGLSGFCPGPAIANAGALRPEALAFIPAMLAGMLIARLGFGADRD